MTRERLRLLAFLGLLNVLWSPVNYLVLTAREGVSASMLIAARWTLFAVALWLLSRVAWFRQTTGFASPRGRLAIYSMLIGAFLQGPSHFLYTWAIPRSSTTETSILNLSSPLWTALLAWLLLREHVTKRRWLAIAIACSGTYLISIGFQLPSLDSGHALGNLVYLLGTILETLAVILSIPIVRASNGMGTLATQVTGVAIGALILGMFVPAVGPLTVTAMTPGVAGAILYLAFIAGLFCFGGWYVLMEKVPISFMVMSLTLQGPLSTLIGVFGRGERITPAIVAGFIAIAGALVLSGSEKALD